MYLENFQFNELKKRKRNTHMNRCCGEQFILRVFWHFSHKINELNYPNTDWEGCLDS